MIFRIGYADISPFAFLAIRKLNSSSSQKSQLSSNLNFQNTSLEQLAPCGSGINAAREHPFYERPCVLNIDFIGSSAVFNTVREAKIHAAACDIRALLQGGVQQYFKRVAVYPVVAVDKKYVLLQLLSIPVLRAEESPPFSFAVIDPVRSSTLIGISYSSNIFVIFS